MLKVVSTRSPYPQADHLAEVGAEQTLCGRAYELSFDKPVEAVECRKCRKKAGADTAWKIPSEWALKLIRDAIRSGKLAKEYLGTRGVIGAHTLSTVGYTYTRRLSIFPDGWIAYHEPGKVWVGFRNEKDARDFLGLT